MSLILPEGYKPFLNVHETEAAIKQIKDFFQGNLAKELNLQRVTAPLFVRSGTGINDDLNGVEKAVSFVVREDNTRIEIVQSLAKWKRMALKEYNFEPGQGIYADMNAIRPDDVIDSTHSIYVDQWDWEKILKKEERTVEFLKGVVRKIYSVIKGTETHIGEIYAEIKPYLPDDITFVHTEDLLEMYPHMTPKEREDAVTKKYGAVFLIGIGGALNNGEPHDGRAPDYDDWITPTSGKHRGLNGDILVWYPVHNRALELSSMGIRVSPESMQKQLEIQNKTERLELMWHKMLMNEELPYTIGGGIGQSRLCMLFLRKAHIGEVQAGYWPEEMRKTCTENGIPLL